MQVSLFTNHIIVFNDWLETAVWILHINTELLHLKHHTSLERVCLNIQTQGLVLCEWCKCDSSIICELLSHLSLKVRHQWLNCFLEKDTLPSSLSTGWFQERIPTWFTWKELLFLQTIINQYELKRQNYKRN